MTCHFKTRSDRGLILSSKRSKGRGPPLSGCNALDTGHTRHQVLYSLAQKVVAEYPALGLTGSLVAFKEEQPTVPFTQDEEDSGTSAKSSKFWDSRSP